MEGLKNSERQKSGIIHFIRRGAELHPGRIAIDDQLNGRRLSYSELHERINRLSRALIGLGIGKGDFVAAMMPNEHSLVETIFACAQIGAIVTPINVRLIDSEVSEYVTDHQCKAAIANSRFADCFEGTRIANRICVGDRLEGWQYYEALIAEQEGILPVATTMLDDPYRLVMTGGTTGKSKGVLHSQGGTIITVLSDVVEYGIGRGWKTVSILPGYHVAGMEWGMFSVFSRAGTVIFPSDISFDPNAYLELVRGRGVEYLPLVPAIINALWDAWDRKPIITVRTVVTTAAPTPLPLRQKLAEIFPEANIFAAAGLSESLNMATQGAGEFLTQPEAIGEPHIDTRIVILDDDDRPVPRGMPGQIVMRNFNTALGYHKDPAAAAVTWRPRRGDPEGLHWCFTGDIGVMDEDGRLTLVDRSKDVIKSGGESVPSVEVETVYAGHPALRELAVIGVEDEKWGEAVVLVAVLNSGKTDPADIAASLFSFGREKIAAYKVPKKIAFVESLPRSHFGKVLKRDLREAVFDRIFEPN